MERSLRAWGFAVLWGVVASLMLSACSSTPAGKAALCRDFAALTVTVGHLDRGDVSEVDALLALRAEQRSFAADASALESEGATDLATVALRIQKSLGDLVTVISQNQPAKPSIAELRAAAQQAPSCP